jgi:uridine kinase
VESVDEGKNKIILVGGYCASGKSVFSNKLSNLLSIPWVKI